MMRRTTLWILWIVALGALLIGQPNTWAADVKPCTVLADSRVEEPLRTIAAEFMRRGGVPIELDFAKAKEVDSRVQAKRMAVDIVLLMAEKKGDKTSVGLLDNAKRVAWKHPAGKPVWAAVVGKHPKASQFVEFVGGHIGHRLWSESKAGFTITTGKTHAEAFDWVARNRVAHTYPMTAMRMLRECGGIREGLCIDIGCGTGWLDVELAKRSKFKIIGLDIDPDMRPFFEKRIRESGLEDRVSFVVGDAQKMPFKDDSADVIVSRGTLTFIPDIGKCLREVDRVLKPTGVAFLGGRYLYTPQVDKITNDQLRQIVRESRVPNAQMIDARGQWVKIIGPKAPKAARQTQGGPHLLAGRFTIDYHRTEGDCLLLCGKDGGLEQGLQKGFVEMTDMQITAIYPKEEEVRKAAKRIREAGLSERIQCKLGTVHRLPFDAKRFDAVVGVGPILLWGDREKGMREIYRVLRPGGAALVGGRFLHMPDWRKTSSDTLRKSASATGIQSIRVIDNMGQWIEILKED